jgi:hypothetical protein
MLSSPRHNAFFVMPSSPIATVSPTKPAPQQKRLDNHVIVEPSGFFE